MTYFELVEKVQKALSDADASSISEHIAVQVNVTGEAEGAFYIEAADGKLNVEPYDYVDRDALLTVSEETLLQVAAGKTTLLAAAMTGKVAFEGNYDKAMQLNDVLTAATKKAKKTATKKAAAPKKTAAKKAVKEEKTEEAAAPKRKCTRTKKAETAAEAPAAEAPAAEAKPAAKKTTRTKKAAKAE